MTIGSIVNSHLSEWWKAKLFILCDVSFWWGCRGDLNLTTAGNESVNPRGSGRYFTVTKQLSKYEVALQSPTPHPDTQMCMHCTWNAQQGLNRDCLKLVSGLLRCRLWQRRTSTWTPRSKTSRPSMQCWRTEFCPDSWWWQFNNTAVWSNTPHRSLGILTLSLPSLKIPFPQPF